MLEKANVSGNAEDRGLGFAPHRKMADFQRVFNGKFCVKELNQRER